MTDSPQSPAGSAAPKESLSQTLRIDIASRSPAAESGEAGRRILTRRTLQRPPVFRTVGAQPAAPAPIGSADFQELFQNVYDAAIVTEQNGRIVEANARASEFLQHTPQALRSLTIFDIISGTNASLLQTIRKNLVDRFVLIELCFCGRKDETYFPAEVAVNRIRLSGSSYLCFFVRDISLRRSAEERLRVEHNAIQNAASGIAITDLQGKLLYTNPAVCRMWGAKDSGDFAGRDVRSLWKDADALTELTDTNPRGETVWTRVMTAARLNGSTFRAQVTGAVNPDAEGRPAGWVFSFMDISDRRRAEEALRESEHQRVMLESLGAACHHLSQPATVLLVSLGIMHRQADSPALNQKSMVASCLGAAETMAEVLHRMLAINEYRTTPYLGEEPGREDVRIIDLGGGGHPPPSPDKGSAESAH